eukprot:TRINITY_DN64524_c0_g1_i1.p1 TRINITY_DN64524_c0_g1~~TRINITY_DN64524_c0_g1_i1.p1  ORF type:complete len:266 (-),score=64.84 TRINITY_DN64524_c0_g1_i1:22-783(-)
MHGVPLEVAPLPSLGPVRLLLSEQKAAAADLERRLWATRALVAAARDRRAKHDAGCFARNSNPKCRDKTIEEEELQQMREQLGRQEVQHEVLAGAEQEAAAEAAAAASECTRLRCELAQASEQAAFFLGSTAGASRDAGELARLGGELAASRASARRLDEELQEVLSVRVCLESRLEGLKEQLSCEATESALLRRRLDEKGSSLSWLRGVARTHVEDLQTNVNSLDANLASVALPPSRGSEPRIESSAGSTPG